MTRRCNHVGASRLQNYSTTYRIHNLHSHLLLQQVGLDCLRRQPAAGRRHAGHAGQHTAQDKALVNGRAVARCGQEGTGLA